MCRKSPGAQIILYKSSGKGKPLVERHLAVTLNTDTLLARTVRRGVDSTTADTRERAVSDQFIGGVVTSFHIYIEGCHWYKSLGWLPLP